MGLARAVPVFIFFTVGVNPRFNDMISSDSSNAVNIHAPKNHRSSFFFRHIIEMKMNPKPITDQSQIGKTVKIDN